MFTRNPWVVELFALYILLMSLILLQRAVPVASLTKVAVSFTNTAQLKIQRDPNFKTQLCITDCYFEQHQLYEVESSFFLFSPTVVESRSVYFARW
jgi:hypothetical protein